MVARPKRPTGTGSYTAGGYVVFQRMVGGKKMRILEHREVMEGVLQRKLFSDETVHHRNGKKDDNRPENLEVWVSRHPKGQRVEDMIKHAEEILQRYAPEKLVDAN